MSDFLAWHPSSAKGNELYTERDSIINLVYEDPKNAFDLLQNHWAFGNISELWDDYVFATCIQPALDKNLEDSDLKRCICRYSTIDHLLFTTYIRREEDPVRFRRAFWNVNVYGQKLSQKFLATKKAKADKNIPKPSNARRIAFVLKGPYKLAHVEFLHSFLQGCLVFRDRINVFLILLDVPESHVKGLPHVEVCSLAKYTNTADKLEAYYNYCQLKNFENICWVACVQNISLFMGMQLAPMQGYWSMKYHSIIMPTIQKYAGLGFGGASFVFDDVTWFRGRAFPELSMSKVDPTVLKSLLKRESIPSNAIVVGCFVRSEKLYSSTFWQSVKTILEFNSNVHFVIASQSIPSSFQTFIADFHYSVSDRFHHIGWVNTKQWVYNLDVYFDSYPRGSCNTIFEAVEAKIPVLMADSSHNRESSALPYIMQAAKSLSLNTTSVYGVFSEERDRLDACLQLIKDSSKRQKLVNIQTQLLTFLRGSKPLFAKDYLNYLLDESLTLR